MVQKAILRVMVTIVLAGVLAFPLWPLTGASQRAEAASPARDVSNVQRLLSESNQQLYVPATSESGAKFVASKEGTWRFTIIGGASEVCPPEAQPDHPEWWGWKTEVLIYKNRQIEWGGGALAPEHPSPANWDFSVGDLVFRPTFEAAERAGKGMFVDIPLGLNEYVLLVVHDCKGCFGDNAGGISLSIELLGSISGYIFEADGKTPIPNGWVNVHKFDNNDYIGSFNTDANGLYKVPGLASGDYRLAANAADHARVMYGGGHDWWAAPPVSVTAPNETPNINFSLGPGATISGKVQDKEGKPLNKMTLKAVPEDGGASICDAASDQSGNYVIQGVPYGEYKVWASGSGWAGGDPRYTREYWQDKPSWATADIVTVSAEKRSVSGINFTLEAATGSISGTVTYDGSQLGGGKIFVGAMPRGQYGPIPYAEVPLSAPGTYPYSIPYLPDGSYCVVALLTAQGCDLSQGPLAPGQILAAAFYQEPVVVSGGTATTGIHLVLQEPRGSISGSISYEGAVPDPGSLPVRLVLALLPWPDWSPIGLYVLSGNLGPYSISHVPDGTCYVGAWLDLDSDGQPDPDEPKGGYWQGTINISGGSSVAGIDVTLYDPASISGVVEYKGTAVQNPADYKVYVGLLDPREPMPPGGVWALRRISIQGPGAYSMETVPAGFYFVVSFMDLNGNGQPDANEPRNAYRGLAVVALMGSHQGGIDISLDDLPQGVARGMVKLHGRTQHLATEVKLEPGNFTTYTWPDGTFARMVPAGSYTITASRLGYLPAVKAGVELGNVLEVGPKVLSQCTLLGGDVNGDDSINPLDLVGVAASFNQTVPETRLSVVEGVGMEPTLHAGELIIVALSNKGLGRGDIVVFNRSEDPGTSLLSRVVGLPGETVQVSEGRVRINGVPLDEPYILEPPAYSFGPQVVPADTYFVLGDNRNHSLDSHTWGCVPAANIKGRVPPSQPDINGDGIVDLYDLSSVSLNFGQSGYIPWP